MSSELLLHLPRDLSAATVARRALERLSVGSADDWRDADLALVVTELVTNAVLHGRGAISLRLQHDGNAIRGEVVDEGGGFERDLRRHGPEEIGGRGLLLVEALCDRWGVHDGTTHVWFELRADQPAGGGRAKPHLGETERPPELR